jgi:hypothetical protein
MAGTVGTLRLVTHTGEFPAAHKWVCADGCEQVLASVMALLRILVQGVMHLADLSTAFAPDAPRLRER